MAQIAEALADKLIKNFALKDIIKHKANPYKNLYEITSTYPNQGVNFKVWRKTWPENSYWVVKDISFKDPSHGKAYGILYWEGQQKNEIPTFIRGGNKRGVWRYDTNNSSAILDNGVEFSAQEIKEYRKSFVQQSKNQEQ